MTNTNTLQVIFKLNIYFQSVLLAGGGETACLVFSAFEYSETFRLLEF